VRICSVEHCGEKHQARGYCKRHYASMVPKEGRRPINRTGCVYPGCTEQKHHAKGYCRKHHAKLYKAEVRRKKGLIPWSDLPHCAATDCKRKAAKHDIFCATHFQRYIHRKYPHDGQYHWSWKGGVAQYPKHSELKRIRKAKLVYVNYKCQEKSPVCTKKATMTHHINGNRGDHSWDNLEPVCSKCHGWLRRGSKNQNSKYGVKLIDVAAEIGVCITTLSALIKHNRGGPKLRAKVAESRIGHLLRETS